MSSPAHFYNTVELRRPERAQANRHAAKQEEIVLTLFRQVGRGLTPWEVCDFFEGQYLITSIRRAMTNLEREGKLEKGDLTDGGYGKPNYRWKLASRPLTEQSDMFPYC